MSESDRRKTPRVYHSGAEKRRQVKERCEKEEAVMSKTRLMTEFLIPQQSQPHALSRSGSSNKRRKEKHVG